MMKIIYQEVIDFPTVDHFVFDIDISVSNIKDLFSPIMIIILFTPAASKHKSFLRMLQFT